MFILGTFTTMQLDATSYRAYETRHNKNKSQRPARPQTTSQPIMFEQKETVFKVLPCAQDGARFDDVSYSRQ